MSRGWLLLTAVGCTPVGLADWEERLDRDGDGFVAAALGGSDCDDRDASVHPGAPERWYDGVDGDCDGAADHDADRDGHAAPPTGPDCDDEDPSVFPGADDPPYDGIDQDCDGVDLTEDSPGEPSSPEDPEQGCACSQAGPMSAGVWALLAVIGLMRRRTAGAGL